MSELQGKVEQRDLKGSDESSTNRKDETELGAAKLDIHKSTYSSDSSLAVQPVEHKETSDKKKESTLRHLESKSELFNNTRLNAKRKKRVASGYTVPFVGIGIHERFGSNVGISRMIDHISRRGSHDERTITREQSRFSVNFIDSLFKDIQDGSRGLKEECEMASLGTSQQLMSGLKSRTMALKAFEEYRKAVERGEEKRLKEIEELKLNLSTRMIEGLEGFYGILNNKGTEFFHSSLSARYGDMRYHSFSKNPKAGKMVLKKLQEDRKSTKEFIEKIIKKAESSIETSFNFMEMTVKSHFLMMGKDEKEEALKKAMMFGVKEGGISGGVLGARGFYRFLEVIKTIAVEDMLDEATREVVKKDLCLAGNNDLRAKQSDTLGTIEDLMSLQYLSLLPAHVLNETKMLSSAINSGAMVEEDQFTKESISIFTSFVDTAAKRRGNRESSTGIAQNARYAFRRVFSGGFIFVSSVMIFITLYEHFLPFMSVEK